MNPAKFRKADHPDRGLREEGPPTRIRAIAAYAQKFSGHPWWWCPNRRAGLVVLAVCLRKPTAIPAPGTAGELSIGP